MALRLMPVGFDVTTRQELRALHLDDSLITKLEAVARRPRPRVPPHRKHPAIKRIEDDVNRVRMKALALLKALEAVDPVIEPVWQVDVDRRIVRKIVTKYAPAPRNKGGRPVNTTRRDLEFQIGRVLDEHGVRLTGKSSGVLGKTLYWILSTDAPDTAGLDKICRRVRDEVAAAKAKDREFAQWVVRHLRPHRSKFTDPALEQLVQHAEATLAQG